MVKIRLQFFLPFSKHLYGVFDSENAESQRNPNR